MAKHPADNLYYVDKEVLYKLNPCYKWYNYLQAKIEKEGRVMITLDALRTALEETKSRAALFTIGRMNDYNAITLSEYREVLRNNKDYISLISNARIVMDTLLMRAKREGKIK